MSDNKKTKADIMIDRSTLVLGCSQVKMMLAMCRRSFAVFPAPMFLAVLVSGLSGTAYSQAIPLAEQSWSAEVIRPRGQPIVPLFDGWFANDDGTRSLCFSYFNLNTEQSFDIPVGSNNHLSDDSYAVLLPTHFDPLPPRYRRKFCTFTVEVPQSFGREDTITWNLSSNGQNLSVPGHVKPAYVLDEPRSLGRGDEAPLVKLSESAEGIRGRRGVRQEDGLQATVNTPFELRAWVEHSDPEVWVGWAMHSGPGNVDFDVAEYELMLTGEPARTTLIFDEPGDYVIRLQTIDDIAAFEFYCCHTNAFFHVSVTD